MSEVTLLLDAQAVLGEGPIWDNEQQRLYWVDILSEKLYVYDPLTGENRSYQVGQMIGTVVPWRDNKVMVAVQDGFASFDLETQTLELITNPEKDRNNRFNDGKCDPAGRFWAGTMALKNQTNQGGLYCLHPDYTVEQKLDQIGISNGIAWSLDQRTMYYIDTVTGTVQAFTYDVDTGHISDKRVIITVPPTMGVPDGMTIDDEGLLWVAHWGGGRVCRWHPETGELWQTITLPASCITSCAFGGKALDTLYITSASHEVSPSDEPLAGGLFAIKTGHRGVKAFRFGG